MKDKILFKYIDNVKRYYLILDNVLETLKYNNDTGVSHYILMDTQGNLSMVRAFDIIYQKYKVVTNTFDVITCDKFCTYYSNLEK